MRRPLIALTILSTLVLSVAPANAASAADARIATPTVTAGSIGVVQKIGGEQSITASCTAVVSQRYSCLQATPPRATVQGRNGTDVVVIPDWCNNGGIWATRTQACEVFGILLTTFLIQNGVRTVTGQLSINAWSYSYSSTDISTWGHQMSLASYAGWGAALSASISGTAFGSGSCTTGNVSYPSQPLSPFLTLKHGEAFFNTTATGLGAIGFCTTTWNLVFTTPGHPPAGLSQAMNQIRCDNAAGANGVRPPRVGCVVPWYASAVTYSQSGQPTLASHVAQAQGSGLPGNSFAAPLTRTTNQTIVNTNRNLACGDAPSIPGMSCDEYPLASSLQGLWAGGTRRTFPGCNINAPGGSGSSGVSACMINATDNSSQGGTMAAFNYSERVLDNDPFRVLIGP